jgi:iron complex outermembrane receptor protein
MRRTLALILFCLPLLTAGEPGVISGTVQDESGAAISGGTVRLDALSGTAYRTATTSAAGDFRFDQVNIDRVLLVVEAPGLNRYVKELSPGSDASQNLTVTLPIGTLPQQVTVTATGLLEDLDDSPRATAVIGRAELDRRIEFSVVESLRELPGVRITQLGGPGTPANIRIRGLRPQDTAVLIDGMRLRDPAATQSDASAFTGDLLTLNISRLELLRGCGSALYGSNAMGGVVNIVSEPGGGKLRGEWLGEGGGLGFLRSQVRLSGGAAQDRLTYSLGAGHLNVLEGVDGDDRARNSSAQGFLQFRAKEHLLLSARVSAANTFLGLNLSPSLTSNAPRTGIVNAIPLSESAIALRDQGLPFAVGDATVFSAANDPDSRRASWLTSALFAADHQLGPRTSYRLAYQLVDTRRSFPNGPGGTGFQPEANEVSTFDGRIDTLQARLNHVADRHTFSAGGEWEREAFDNGGLSQSLTGAASGYRAQVAQRSTGVFAEDRLRFLDARLQVTLSGRWQQFHLQRPIVSGDLPEYLSTAVPDAPSAFTGDASVMYRIVSTSTKLRAHVGNAYRAPSLYERYGTGYFGGFFTPYGDPRLQPERSLGGDAGIDQYFGQRKARLSATYFYTQLRSVIGFDFTGLINRTTDPFGRSSGYFSTGGGLARGVELEGQVTLWRGFQLNGSYTHTRTLERQAIAIGTLRTPRIFAHTVAFSALQTWRRLTLTTNFLGASDFLGVISGRAVNWPGPRRLDATASYRLGNWEKVKPELHGRVENLLNQRYFEDGFRTPRRWVVAGLRVSF